MRQLASPHNHVNWPMGGGGMYSLEVSNRYLFQIVLVDFFDHSVVAPLRLAILTKA